MQDNFPMNYEHNSKYMFPKELSTRIINEDFNDDNDINTFDQYTKRMQCKDRKSIENNIQSTLVSNRLSCKELENLKERYVDFISPKIYSQAENDDYKYYSSPKLNGLHSKTSKSCAQLAYVYQRTLYSSKHDINNDYTKLKPDPPQRTVSIRHSAHYLVAPAFNLNELSFTDDDLYSPFITPSISSTSSSNSSHGNSGVYYMTPIRNCKSTTSLNESADDVLNSFGKIYQNDPITERLTEDELNKIRVMYQSMSCMVHVSHSTANFYTTHSDQIANLQDCWKLQLDAIVPVWILDQKNGSKLKLIFANKTTAFSYCETILIGNSNQFKSPKEKHITFRVDNLICLIQFHDYVSCSNFYKFYINFESNLNGHTKNRNNKNSQNLKLKFIKRQQKHKTTKTGASSPLCVSSEKINKNFISSPCAFQHVNSIKNIDQDNIHQIAVRK
jgi:hypothetical protein